MRLPKPVIKAFISTIVMLVLFVGAGVGYTWYVGQDESQVASAVPAPVETTPQHHAIKPTKPRPDSGVSASVQMITSPVTPGSNSSITIKTTPTAVCNISVIYDTVASKDSGLAPKAADDFGMVSWTWTVEESVPHGKWPVKVVCEFNKRSAVVVGDLVVTNQVTP